MTINITGQTKLLGIIGDPLSHTLSPIMQNAAIAHLSQDLIYIPFWIKAPDLATLIEAFWATQVIGFNVTIPHKKAIIPYLKEITQVAELIQAVNTVYRTPVGWVGTNTDIAGFIAPLLSYQRNWHDTKALILGNGGAAQAVLVGLVQLGCYDITVIGRDSYKLNQFADMYRNKLFPIQLTLCPWDKLSSIIDQSQLIVNTTPIGMYPHSDQTPIPDPLIKQIKPSTIIYDLIYRPRPTRLLQQAREIGAIAIDGTEMLIQQGAAALEIWLQQPPPIEVMRQALLSQVT